jgi:hypothetical protein
MSFSANFKGEGVMTLLLILAAIALPNIDLPSNCRAEQTAIPPGPDNQNIYANCMRDEQAAHDGLVKKWATVPAAVQGTCAEMGRLVGSYVEISVCVDIDAGSLSASSPQERAPRQRNH